MNQSVTLKRDLRATGDMEKRMSRIKEDVVRYRRVEQSEELREFRSLQAIVETKEFQDRKHYLLTRKYRHTDEFKQLRRFYILRNHSPRVHGYLLHQHNSSLCEYLVFSETEEYVQLQDTEAVEGSPVLRKYKRIERSFVLRSYRRCEQSKDVQEYLALRALIATKDFQERRAFWRNAKRWYTTPESQQDARYTALKESDDIRFFLAQNAEQIAEWERYHLAMSDDFEGTTWQNGRWDAGFFYNNPNLKADHSYVNEQQANNHGKNASVHDSVLRVETRKEKATASAWHPTKGFIEQAYQYTGDVLQAGQHFQQAEGLFMAKVRFRGKTHAAAYIGTGTRLPLISLAQWNGKKVSVGMATGKDAVRMEVEGKNPSKWLIYSVLLTKKDIVWYINNQEVMRRPNTFNGTLFYPAVATFLPSGAAAGTGSVEVDWVRAYTIDL